mgnify:CR=1 FL=1
MKNKEQLVDFLARFITEERWEMFRKVVEQRTRYITVVLEDIYQPHNASAVLRSMDCFGIQDAHIIENTNEYHINPDLALGASKWLSLNRYNHSANNTHEAINRLRKVGYRIVATTPHDQGVSLPDFDVLFYQVVYLLKIEGNYGIDQIVVNHHH